MTVRSPVWHPFTQHALAPPAIPIAAAEGAWLTTTDGRRLFDGISSWWVVTHGHRHPRIVEAIQQQAAQLDQVIFAGFTHEPAERLAAGLIELAPDGLSHVFFSDSGSTAVEVALKMALGYWRNIGQARTRVAALEYGYHGDTVGTMSAGARGVYTAAYEPFLFDVVRLPFPNAGKEQATLDAFEAATADGSVTALVVEPLLLGAGGMLMYAPSVLAGLRRICDATGTLLIADEVMTGWGRTGTLFACRQANVVPDILCTAKGLTGGSLPLAATLCSSAIYDAHLSADRARTFFHSSSYTANPIACAAALANLRVWDEEPVAERVIALGAAQAAAIASFRGDDRFQNVRQLGTITALDLAIDDPGYLSEAGPRLAAHFIDRNVLLRPLGSTIYVMPPYCTTADDLALVYDAISSAADVIRA